MKQRVIALGFFDGVHLGHGKLLQKTRQLANEYGCTAAALTFDRYPGSMVSGEQSALLTDVEDRTELMQELYGIDEVLCPAFDRAFMQMDWERFVTELLRGELHACHVVCGYDYCFGKGGEGTPEKLAALCAALGLGFDCLERLELDGVTVSSRYIRQLIAAGEVARAAEFLGHPHRLSGIVIPGQQLGRRLGFPTANLRAPEQVLLPSNGVYAVRATVLGQCTTGVCNIGTRPTVGGEAVTVETWLDGVSGSFYGQKLRVEFYRRLRPERKFSSLEALREEILRNHAQAQAFFTEQPKTTE